MGKHHKKRRSSSSSSIESDEIERQLKKLTKKIKRRKIIRRSRHHKHGDQMDNHQDDQPGPSVRLNIDNEYSSDDEVDNVNLVDSENDGDIGKSHCQCKCMSWQSTTQDKASQ